MKAPSPSHHFSGSVAPSRPMPLPHNFARVSGRDELVYGSSRPGYSKDNEKPGAVTTEEVVLWCQFMQENGVRRILSLLGDDEVEWYAEPIADSLAAHGFDGNHYTRAGVFVDGAVEVMLDAFKRADAAGEKIVVHCSGGGGRASLGFGVWLMHKYGLSAEEAAQEIADTAAVEGSNRRPDAAKLQQLMDNGTLKKKDKRDPEAAGRLCWC